VLVHHMEEARQVANRKRDDRQKRRKKIAAAPVRTTDDARNSTPLSQMVPRTRTLAQHH